MFRENKFRGVNLLEAPITFPKVFIYFTGFRKTWILEHSYTVKLSLLLELRDKICRIYIFSFRLLWKISDLTNNAVFPTLSLVDFSSPLSWLKLHANFSQISQNFSDIKEKNKKKICSKQQKNGRRFIRGGDGNRKLVRRRLE